MITGDIYKGLMAFSLFVSDYKSRGHTVNPFIYVGLTFSWILTILSTPLLLFMDFSWLIISWFIEYYEKHEPITKSYKRHKK